MEGGLCVCVDLLRFLDPVVRQHQMTIGYLMVKFPISCQFKAPRKQNQQGYF